MTLGRRRPHVHARKRAIRHAGPGRRSVLRPSADVIRHRLCEEIGTRWHLIFEEHGTEGLSRHSRADRNSRPSPSNPICEESFNEPRDQTTYRLALLAVLVPLNTAHVQRDAGSKIRGEYSFSGNSAGSSMRSARDYSGYYRQYAHSAQPVNPEVARDSADAIGTYITKAQRHFAWMRTQA